MTRKDALLQFAAAVFVFLIFSLWIRVPGYMDAEYYTLSAAQLAGGKGLTQPIIWNYLDDPTGIPHPSHTYWMPAPSLVAAAAMRISGKPDFLSGRVPFILLAALVAPAAGWMGFRFSGRRLIAWLAAGFSIFCGYYVPYTGTVDSFFLVMAGAWIIFFCLDRLSQKQCKAEGGFWLLCGAAGGWLHLNRADGFLWLALVVVVWTFQWVKARQALRAWKNLLFILLGYGSLMGFWYYRNLIEFGSLFIPHTSRALWLTTYNELFSFPPELLTIQHWVSSGVNAIIADRIGSLGRNLITAAAVQGMIILLPFLFVAIWKRRDDQLVRMSVVMELVILVVMSLVFPYSGRQGGFLHSSAALQPLIWGLSAAGLVDVVSWAAEKRRWQADRAIKMFVTGSVLLCALITVFIFQMVAIGANPQTPSWQESDRRAHVSSELLEANQIPANARIMINNPAGFGLVSRREALVIPNGGPEITLAVADKFKVDYLLLEKNIVHGLLRLYSNPEEFSSFSLIDKREDQLLLRINRTEGAAE